jgi:hypothetical protein
LSEKEKATGVLRYPMWVNSVKCDYFCYRITFRLACQWSTCNQETSHSRWTIDCQRSGEYVVIY